MNVKSCERDAIKNEIHTCHVIAVALVPLPVVGPIRMVGFEKVNVVIIVGTDHFGAVVIEHCTRDIGLRLRIDLRQMQEKNEVALKIEAKSKYTEVT